MKMGAWGGLGASFWHLGAILGPRWRPRSPRGAPRGAKQANMAPRWANLAPRWVPNWCQNHKKSIEKLMYFLIVFLNRILKDLEAKIDEKSKEKSSKIWLKSCCKRGRRKLRKKHWRLDENEKMNVSTGPKSIKNRRKNGIQNVIF